MLGSAYIALGANLSEPNITLERAINRLSATADIRLRQRSRLYRTVPIDAAGPDFGRQRYRPGCWYLSDCDADRKLCRSTWRTG